MQGVGGGTLEQIAAGRAMCRWAPVPPRSRTLHPQGTPGHRPQGSATAGRGTGQLEWGWGGAGGRGVIGGEGKGRGGSVILIE